MANLITQTQVLTKLNNLMGRRTLNSSNSQDDLKGYCQDSFDYAWRYYRWGFSLKRAVIDLVNDPYLPDNFDIDGYQEVASTVDQPWTYVPIEEYDAIQSGDRFYTLEYDDTLNRYKFLTSFTATTVTVIYQKTPPTLGDTGVPFPSAMSIAVGATVFSKQADNPRSADISQEWDEFHSELDRHTGRSENNKPMRRVRTRQDKAGTYTGDVGDY
jgi:hypothetical protein